MNGTLLLASILWIALEIGAENLDGRHDERGRVHQVRALERDEQFVREGRAEMYREGRVVAMIDELGLANVA